MPQYSDLENAINTLVTQFHSASADNAPTLKPEEFKSLVSTQLPSMVKVSVGIHCNHIKSMATTAANFCKEGIGSEQVLSEILRKMGVGDGEGISFKHFWNLIQSIATSQHSILGGQKGSCGCILL